VRANVTAGSILLLHEGRAHSQATILAVVDALLALGYRFIIPDPTILSQTPPAPMMVEAASR
jgi:hypothetical protein